MNKSTENLHSSRHRVILSWLTVAIWAAIIFLFSSQSTIALDIGAWDFVLRKLAHMGEFGVLFLLLWKAIRELGVAKSKALAIAAALSMAYAASDEIHQSFVPGRSPTVRDVAIDFTGIMISILVLYFYLRSRRSREVAQSG